jgi:hypothetical protein
MVQLSHIEAKPKLNQSFICHLTPSDLRDAARALVSDQELL